MYILQDQYGLNKSFLVILGNDKSSVEYKYFIAVEFIHLLKTWD